MKALKSKSLMSLIYAVLLALPLCAILSRVIYVQSNKNAYQSYSGYNIETNTELATNIQSGLDYQLSYMSYSGTMTSDTAFSIDNLVVASSYTSLQNFYNTYKNDIEYLRFGVASNVYRVYFYRSDMSLIDHYSLSIGQPTTISFKATSNTTLNNNDLVYRIYQQQVGNSLDNVFEYSVSQFVSENDFGQLNFFQWYDELLLSNNSHNALYIHFANWYLNYAMLISLMQILFLVLMWFVNFARKLLDRGMNYDW